MPETPEEFWERAKGALRTPPVEEWDSWPFDGAIAPRALEPPVPEEPLRHGVGGVDCWHCNPADPIWSDERWFVRSFDQPTGLPVVVILETRRHVDFPDLDADEARELGPVMLRIHAAVARVPGIGNVHVGRWGEGSEHCHIWFFGRPARMTQLRSSFAAIWDDVLPPTPDDVWAANLEIVRAELEAS